MKAGVQIGHISASYICHGPGCTLNQTYMTKFTLFFVLLSYLLFSKLPLLEDSKGFSFAQNNKAHLQKLFVETIIFYEKKNICV